MDLKILDDFKEEFLKIKKIGWIQSNRFHDTGIGKTFEDFLGVIENNKASADYKDTLELKSGRELSKSMITLFTKSPDPKGMNTKLKNDFGYEDQNHKPLKILHTTISGDKFNTLKGNHGFKLQIEKDKLTILVKDLKTGEERETGAYYPFSKLKKIIEKKCKMIAFISADSKKDNGQEFFKFNNATILSDLGFDDFLKLVEQGVIKYDIRLGVYRSGKNLGKAHDHGSGFRVHKKDLEMVFKISQLN